MVQKQNWNDIIRQAEINSKKEEAKERRDRKKYILVLRKFISVQLLIGLIAAFSLYMEFGWQELERILLSWVIGLTLVGTFLTILVERYRKITLFK